MEEVVTVGMLEELGEKLGDIAEEIKEERPGYYSVKVSPGKLVEAARRLGYRVVRVDRRLEPTREVEGYSMRWIAEQASRLGAPPDIVYDEGDVGKEAMIRVLGSNAVEAVEKLLRIIEEASRG